MKVNRKANCSYSYADFTDSVILKPKYLVKIKKHIITSEEGREHPNKSPFYTLINMKEDKIRSFLGVFRKLSEEITHHERLSSTSCQEGRWCSSTSCQDGGWCSSQPPGGSSLFVAEEFILLLMRRVCSLNCLR